MTLMEPCAPPADGCEAAVALALAQRGEPVRARRETHTARVLLTDTKAYKIKKAVRFAFLDLSTPAVRRRMCEEEVRLGRPLAAALHARVRALALTEDGWRVGPPDAPHAVEWLVEMARFDEDATLAAHLTAGRPLEPADADAIGRRLAAFHAGCRVVLHGDWDARVAALMTRNIAELRGADADAVLDPRAVAALERFAGTVAERHGDVLRTRGRGGAVREGHGDLRAEHVVLSTPLLIVDRLEFDVDLRTVDVADDLAFLATDLEALGARAAADAIVAAYARFGGDAGTPALRALYGVHRALVRSKVMLLQARHAEARDLAALAERLAWRSRPPALVLVTGPPASGKTTLATALGARTGASVLSSDRVRKEQLGLVAGAAAPAAAYTPERRRAVYAELGRRAGAALARGEQVIVDATFGSADQRAAFRATLGQEPPGGMRVVTCVAPPALRERRAAGRAGTGDSDAGRAVATRLGAQHTAFPAEPGAQQITAATVGDAAARADEVLRALETA